MVVAVPLRVVGLVMGFGSGVLISAVAFELTEEALGSAGYLPVAIWLAVGASVYLVGDWLVGNAGAHRRKSPVHGGVRHGTPKETAVKVAGSTSGAVLVVGALLDGIPESAAIGISLLDGAGVGIAFVIAVFLSNVPESLAATSGLVAAGHRKSRVLAMWLAVCLLSAVVSAIGYAALGNTSPMVLGSIQSFAAGAVLAMLATTMLPEAVEHAGRWVGIATVLGFASAVLLGAV